MDDILAISLHSMHHDAARLQRIGMNVANAQTPAYKRQVVAALPFGALVDGLASVQAAGEAAAQRGTAAPAGFVERTDLRAGTLRASGQSLDLALAGPGWFEVQTPEGPAYTRLGSFAQDAQGRLVTRQGHPVMGRGGDIVLGLGTPVIDASGQVFDGAAMAAAAGAPVAPVAQLRVVNVEAGTPMRPMGDGLYQAAGAQALEPKDYEVRQGYLENSNVSSLHEMVDLMQTLRHFESMQRVAVSYDEMLGTTIRKLGDPA